ncbi:MAG: hypothetical protein JRD89_03570 [Deltaproteobacteria bacterium]|nr:hypothetical protein [Deltaproteobacteria bacterium]
MTGAERIASERQRQLDKLNWTAEHDDGHADGALALAAVCYASPVRLYVVNEYARGRMYQDPWPWPGEYCDKRFYTAHATAHSSNVPPNPDSFTKAERVDLLVKAGALIAAEIDRLERVIAETGGEDG